MATKVELTKNKLERLAKLFEEIPNSQIIDERINNTISMYTSNKIESNVFMKVVLINYFYKTSIFDTKKMAKHIFKNGKNIDSKLKKENFSVIDDIRKGHGIGTNGKKSKKEKDFYSFATKYAHFHNPKTFPIYDKWVKRLLPLANRSMKFHEGFSQKELKNYKTHKLIINSLKEHLNITGWNYKKIDQGLYLWSKYLYKPKSFNSYPSSFQNKLKSIINSNN